MRFLPILLLVSTTPSLFGADAFDLYTNPILAKIPAAEGVKEITRLTPELITDHDRLLPGTSGAFVVVRTNENRWSKLLVSAARQKTEAGPAIPLLLIERFVTFKDGSEQAIHAGSRTVSLFAGFRFSLDLGQIVPEVLGGDLHFLVEGDNISLQPLKKAKIYLVTKQLAEATPRKTAKVVVGEKFETRYFNGTYLLHDDGRRSGKLVLKVSDDGDVTGSYYSEKDGEKYEVRGRTGAPAHGVEFAVTFPRSEQMFKGLLFTGDAKAIAGTSRLGGREAGFYAVRIGE